MRLPCYNWTTTRVHKLQGRRIIFFTILQLVFYFYIIDY